MSGLDILRKFLRALTALGLASPWQFQAMIFMDYSSDPLGPVDSEDFSVVVFLVTRAEQWEPSSWS